MGARPVRQSGGNLKAVVLMGFVGRYADVENEVLRERVKRQTEQGLTNREKQLEDLKKALFYLQDEIANIENGIVEG